MATSTAASAPSATHTPPIVSDVSGMTEFVEHGRNGAAADPFDRIGCVEVRMVRVNKVSQPRADRIG